MNVSFQRLGAAAAALVLLFEACTHAPAPVQRSSARSSADEIELLKAGPADAPMLVVTNETTAGKAILAAPSLPAFPEDPGVEILISRMLASVKQQEGVGIAAPQVGISRRVIVVQRQDLTEEPFVAYLNPRITSCSEDKVIDYEGCLSVPGWFGQVSRSAAITVSYVAPDGRTAVEEVKGWTARIFQHEIDHLNGVLFLDNREPGELIPEEEYRRLKEERKKQRRDQPTNANSPQA